jgi:hypothetical protein
MKTYLILTVGTGTAGRHSNLAAGLRRTLEMIRPECYWLVPSASEDSILVADLVREGIDGFRPWDGEGGPYRCIVQHDSLADCRGAVREVIVAARRVDRGARLLVNPTSGTKQMSAGATLAALDEGVGEIVFTVGERADGVVMTGTEKLETFDASAYFAERDLRTAEGLFRAGSFLAAARVVEPHESLVAARDVALCMAAWDQFDYEGARQTAARSAAPALGRLRSHFGELAKVVRSGEPSMLVVADILDNARQHQQRGDHGPALVLACKAVEMALRFALWSQTGLGDPYELTGLEQLPVPQPTKDRFRTTSHDGKTTVLGLRQVADILGHLVNPLAGRWVRNRELRDAIAARNDLTHKIRSVSPAEAAAAVDAACDFVSALPIPPVPVRPSSLTTF